ncbi:MAG: hypothetical protein GX643_02090 [Acidimicrobiales bacterium]|nr:hypothetical protein [Acidimicrobiales bacterium]
MLLRGRSSRGRSLRAAVLLVAVLVATLAGCSDDGDPTGDGDGDRSGSTVGASVDRASILAAVADDLIVPGYDDLSSSLDVFAESVSSLCSSPGDSELAAARDAWRPAIAAWETTTAFGIGPAMEHRLMSAVAFAARPAAIDRVLAGDRGVDPESVRIEGAAVHGLIAAEHVLFTEVADVLVTPGGGRTCEYLHSVAVLAADAAGSVAEEWGGAARRAFVESTGSGAEDSLPLLLNAVTHRVKAVDERSLRDIVAADSYDDLADGRKDGPAGVGLSRQRTGLLSAIDVIGAGPTGISAIVRERSPETADRLEAAAAAASAAVAGIPESVAGVWVDDATREQAAVAAEEVAALKVILVTEVASQLGVTITLSDGDGDS